MNHVGATELDCTVANPLKRDQKVISMRFTFIYFFETNDECAESVFGEISKHVDWK